MQRRNHRKSDKTIFRVSRFLESGPPALQTKVVRMDDQNIGQGVVYFQDGTEGLRAVIFLLPFHVSSFID